MIIPNPIGMTTRWNPLRHSGMEILSEDSMLHAASPPENLARTGDGVVAVTGHKP